MTAGVVVVLVAAAVVVARSGDGGGLHDYEQGPVYTGSATRNSIPVFLNETFTFGQPVVFNKTERTAVLEAVRVRPALPEGMEIVHVSVVGPDRQTNGVATMQAWPAADHVGHLRPLKGARVPPETTRAGKTGVELVFGLKVSKPGFFGFAEIDVDYRIGATQ